MLSAKFHKSPAMALVEMKRIAFPVMGSTKIDGFRCHIHRGVAYSRKNKMLPNWYVQEVLSAGDFNGFDGELAVGKPNTPGLFGRTSSGVTSHGGSPDFHYHVFDLVDESGTTNALKRYGAIPDLFGRVTKHPMKFISSLDELYAYDEENVLAGWEGTMIRHPDSPYKQGRSTLREGYLIKLKRFLDSEAEILGCYEQETNNNEATINEIGRSKRSSHKENKVKNGHLGGFHVRDIHTGIEFDVGILDGVTQAERKQWWELEGTHFTGKIIRYRYFPVGVKIKPRHATFTGFRSEIDIIREN